MKYVLYLVGFIFAMAFVIRFLEMSMAFDWTDVIWTFLFFLAALICAGFAKAVDRDQ